MTSDAGAETGRLPVTTFAVLGQIAEGPASGYEVKARLEAGAAQFWHASYSQIYAELRRLERLGYVTEERVLQEGRPNKRVYTITDAGRGALRDWLGEPWGLAHLRDESLVKLTLASSMPVEDVIAELREPAGDPRGPARRLRGAHRRPATRLVPLSEARPAQGRARPGGLCGVVRGGRRRADRLRGRPRHASRCRQVVWAAATGKFGPPKKAGKG